MAKYSKLPKISKEKQQELLISFCKALAEIRTAEEAAEFLKDLLSKQEAEMLAKRIEIARLLIEGTTYEIIKKTLKVSESTIARVNQWLTTSGEGYRLIVKRVKPEKSEKQNYIEELEKPISWKSIKRNYPSYFWPEIILEEVVKNARKSHKQKLIKILDRFDEKSEMFESLRVLLKSEYKNIKKL